MRNRAKCKICNEILESFHQHDYVSCKCGEIAIDGGTQYFRCSAKNWDNFLRLDDLDNVVIPKIVDETPKENVIEDIKPLTKKQKIEMLHEMVKNIEKLPERAMTEPITHYDFYSYMVVITSILRG